MCTVFNEHNGLVEVENILLAADVFKGAHIQIVEFRGEIVAGNPIWNGLRCQNQSNNNQIGLFKLLFLKCGLVES